MGKTQAQNERDKQSILNKVWEEVKKINWKEINDLTSKDFVIGLIGNEQEIDSMIDWLKRFNDSSVLQDYKIEDDLFKLILSKHTINILTTGSPENMKLKNFSFCLVTERNKVWAHNSNTKYYVFDASDTNLSKYILSNNKELSFALAYNFPAFRVEVSNESIQNTSIQNTSWAIVTASPNIVPGPHQFVTVPIEAISDFTVLTANQTKMLFEQVGLNGRHVNPINCIMEFGIVLGFAMLAKTIATNVVGKVPAGAGIIAKGAVAYAFTTVIGEAIFYYLNTGKRMAYDMMKNRFEIVYEDVQDLVKNIIKKEKKS